MDKIDNFINYLEELAVIKETLELTTQLITTLVNNWFLRKYKSGLDVSNHKPSSTVLF